MRVDFRGQQRGCSFGDEDGNHFEFEAYRHSSFLFRLVWMLRGKVLPNTHLPSKGYDEEGSKESFVS